MTLFEVAFRARYNNPISNITLNNPSLKIYQWCNDKHDIIELVMQRQEKYHRIRENISKVFDIVDEIHSGGNTHVITRVCVGDKI